MTYSKLLRTMFEGDPLGMEQQVDFEQMYGDPSNLHLTPKLHPASETEQPDPGAEGMAAPTDYAGAMMPPGAPGGDMGQPGAMPPGGMPSPDQMQQIQPGMQPQQQPGMQENVMKDDLDLYLDALLDESVDELTEGPFDYEGPNPGGYPAQRGFYAGGGQPAYAGRPAAPGGGGFGWETQGNQPFRYSAPGFVGTQQAPASIAAAGPQAIRNWQGAAGPYATGPIGGGPPGRGYGAAPTPSYYGTPSGNPDTSANALNRQELERITGDYPGSRPGGGGDRRGGGGGGGGGGGPGAGGARAAAASAGRPGGDPATRELQQNLAKQGYDIGKTGVDGIMGPRTQAAVQARNTAQNNGIAQNRAAGAGPFDREKDLTPTRTTMGTGQNLPGGGGAADREKDLTPTTSKMAGGDKDDEFSPAGRAMTGHDIWGNPAAEAGHQTFAGRLFRAPEDTLNSLTGFRGQPAKPTAPAATAATGGEHGWPNTFLNAKPAAAAAAPAAATPAAATPAAATPAAATPAAAAPANGATQGLSFKGGTIGNAADSVRNAAGVNPTPAGPAAQPPAGPAAQPPAGPPRTTHEERRTSGSAPPAPMTPGTGAAPAPPAATPVFGSEHGWPNTSLNTPATPAPTAQAQPSAGKTTVTNAKDWGLDWSDYNLLYESDRATEKKIRGY